MKRSLLTTAAAIGVLAVAACGGGGSGGGTSNPYPGGVPTAAPTSAPTSPSSGAPASMPQLGTVSGTQAYVSSSNQHTLYTFGADSANVSNCTTASGCTAVWPPYTAPAGTIAPSGSGFGIITRSDGTLQWTYQQFPLYNYVGDSASGQGNGNGLTEFGGLWGVAHPASAATPGPTSSPSHCVGYYC